MSARTSLVALLAAIATLAAIALPARADELQAVTIYRVVGSPSGDRMYVATGGDQVLVTDPAGREVGRISDLPFSIGLATGPDGTLWVALGRSHEVVAVDPSTLTIRARYPTPENACPGDLAVTSRFVVFGFSCFFYAGISGDTGVGVIDTDTGQVSTTITFKPAVQPMVATSTALAGRVLTIDYASSPTALVLFDVSTGALQFVTARAMDIAIAVDMAISPDGSTVALADKRTDVIETFSTSDLSPGTAYRLGVGGQSVAWSSDGTSLAGSRYSISDPDSGAVFTVGQPEPRARFMLPAEGPERFPATRSLVSSADGQQLTVGTRAFWEARAFLELRGIRPSAITASGSGAAIVGRPASFQATLTFEGQPAPAGAMLLVSRQPDGVAESPVGTAVTGAGGVATITDTPDQVATTTWIVRFRGNERFGPAEARYTAAVAKAPTTITIAFVTQKARAHHLEGTIVVGLGPVLDARVIAVTATTSAGTSVITYSEVSATEDLRIPFTVVEPTTLTATYSSPRQETASASTTVRPR